LESICLLTPSALRNLFIDSLRGKRLTPAENSLFADPFHKEQGTLLRTGDCIIYAARAFAVLAVICCRVFKEFTTNSTGYLIPASFLSRPISPPFAKNMSLFCSHKIYLKNSTTVNPVSFFSQYRAEHPSPLSSPSYHTVFYLSPTQFQSLTAHFY